MNFILIFSHFDTFSKSEDNQKEKRKNNERRNF